MIAESKFLNQSIEFWANVKLINQKVGYTYKKMVKVPNLKQIKNSYIKLGLDYSQIIEKGKATLFGSLLLEYFEYRAHVLNTIVEPNLMNVDEARALFYALHEKLQPRCPIPKNKQRNEKAGPSLFTGIINMLIEANLKGYPCSYDPKELTSFTKDGFPSRSLSRRVDGSFPNVINPIALWEIKEYYYTTSFGSRIADGVYESQLDGYELKEAREHLGREIHHYLMVDAYKPWWGMGKSYLCRIIDMLHMGLLTEVLFGKEVIGRLPVLVNQWKVQYDIEGDQYSPCKTAIQTQIWA